MNETIFIPTALPVESLARNASRNRNRIAAVTIWAALILSAIMVILFGDQVWFWLCFAAVLPLIAVSTVAASRRSADRLSHEQNFLRLEWLRRREVVARKPLPQELLVLRDVHKSYTSANGEITEVLRGVNLTIEQGSFSVIRGESGSGKTSLLRILGLLDSRFDGSYLFIYDDIKEKPDWYQDELRSDNIGFIFQDGQLFTHMTMRENIALPVRLQSKAEQRRNMHERIAALARTFFTENELEKHILSSRPKMVSGGQKQRAAIMRSVINRPAIILADEPTASLDEERKNEVLLVLLSLKAVGHTVIVVSHDKVFYQTGRQLELAKGVLREIASDQKPAKLSLQYRSPPKGNRILYGWFPRAPIGILIRQAMRETFLRPIFLFLVLVSLCVGVCQIGVFASIIVGTQTFLDDAMTRGSRLNRLEIKPRTADLEKLNRFPVVADVVKWDGVKAVVPRRAALVRIYNADSEKNVYSAMGLQTNDQEYQLLNFVAGGPFNPDNEELEVIVTAALLSDLFKEAADLGNGIKHYADFIAKSVMVEVPQFARSGQELAARARKIQLKIVGIILYAEGGRQLYLPNGTLLVFDRYKMDREGTVVMPVVESGAAWTEDRTAIKELSDFPWEDQVQVYTRQIRDIIPIFQRLSELGYKPASDIWGYKWVLDVRDLAWKIFIPLLAGIVLAVGLTVATNLFSSAKLREAEFALWRILGMRRGDLVITQVISTIMMVLVGAALGLLLGKLLVDGARAFMAATNPGAGLEKVFAPVDQFFTVILLCSVVVGVVSAIYPAINTARSDPAKVLQS
jgi:putative ABC transport system ATP-binding protein